MASYSLRLQRQHGADVERMNPVLEMRHHGVMSGSVLILHCSSGLLGGGTGAGADGEGSDADGSDAGETSVGAEHQRAGVSGQPPEQPNVTHGLVSPSELVLTCCTCFFLVVNCSRRLAHG